MVSEDERPDADPDVHDVRELRNEPADEMPTTGGGVVPAAHGGTGTDTGTPGIGPSAGEPGPHQPTPDANAGDFDINAGTNRDTYSDTERV